MKTTHACGYVLRGAQTLVRLHRDARAIARFERNEVVDCRARARENERLLGRRQLRLGRFAREK